MCEYKDYNKIVENNDLINNLCIDKSFGIYTRNYIDNIFMKQYKNIDYTTIIVDFDQLKELNIFFGYENVNSVFRKMFKEFQNDHNNVTIARWFYGDEIALITTGKSKILIDEFRKHCSKYCLTFKVLVVTHVKLDEIKIVS